jgi:hypothetical protein
MLEKTFNLKKEISSLALNLNEEITEKEVNEKWNPYIPQEEFKFTIAADGSLNKRHYLGFYLYSIAGYSFGKKEDGTAVEEVVGDINLSVIKKTEFAESYFRLLMFLAETKALLKLAVREKPEILLIDGTLSSRFILPPPKTNWFINEEFKGELAKLSGQMIKDIEKNIFNYDLVSFSQPIKNLAIEKLVEKFGEGKGLRRDILEAVLSKLAYFEYFILLHYLFYKLDWNPLIIGVAKTSHDTEIFNKSIPDIKLFQQHTKDLGYSESKYVDIENKSKIREWEFSEIFENIEKQKAEELKEVQIKYFYSKYDKGQLISLIEVYENPEGKSISPAVINDYLKYFSVGGYPFLLKKVDNEVRITHKDMDLIENLLDLKNEIKGREGLE